jgi:hypothetical protein
MSLPELKNTRYREEPRKKGGVKKIAQAYLAPGPNVVNHPSAKARCPMGPGMGDIPAEGHWCDVTPYLLRRVRCGDLVEATPPAAPKKVEPPKGKKKE